MNDGPEGSMHPAEHTAEEAEQENTQAAAVEPAGQSEFEVADEALKALIEALIYLAPDPFTVDVISNALPAEDRARVKLKLEELVRDYERAEHGISRQQ